MDAIGAMRHRIEIYSISTTTDPARGGETSPSEVLLATVWAAWEVVETKSGEVVLAGQKDERTTVNFTIRYRGDVKETMVIKYESLYYNILSVLPDTKRCYTTLETVQLGENWSKT